MNHDVERTRDAGAMGVLADAVGLAAICVMVVVGFSLPVFA